MGRTGERKSQILQTLAHMLEDPAPDKVTTARLAAKLELSEAALYRHFSGKAQMYEGLIEFVEQTLFALINKITSEEKSGTRQVEAIVGVLLGFAQKNRGMTRVLIGDALVHEDDRLQARINQLHDRLEAALKQGIRFGITQHEIAEDVDPTACANLVLSFVTGRWHQFAKSGFKRDPVELWPKQWQQLMQGVLSGD
jgi:TetR/AcrR family transcriptional regulator